MKYRKKPVEVEAFCLPQIHLSAIIKTLPGWFSSELAGLGRCEVIPDKKGNISCVIVKTLEGEMKAYVGDYIIKGVEGEIYPCKETIFLETYEPC